MRGIESVWSDIRCMRKEEEGWVVGREERRVVR